MSLASTDADGVRIVTMNDSRIDAAIAIRFKEDMRTATEDAPGRVVLDLSQVDFIDSSGLGAACVLETQCIRSSALLGAHVRKG